MLKIKKLAPRSWAGAGFGTKPASYGVENRPDIRVIRESHGWTAYTPQGKLFGETKAELETQLN
jgi:hypothetical protein